MKKKIIFIIIILVLCLGIFYYNNKFKENIIINLNPVDDLNFSTNFLKNVNQIENNNYLLSPYSVKVALSMLRDGANNRTKEEINNVIGKDKITLLNNKSIHIANALFIKNDYKKGINKSYQNELKKDYKSEILFDDFKTPKVINDWGKKETNNMIDKILDSIDSSFVLGMANALAIDVKWKYEFKCDNTTKMEFNNRNSKKTQVEMMHNSYTTEDIKYLKSNDATGIIIPYEDSTNLEFIGLLPNDNINNYINNFDINKLDEMENQAIIGNNNTQINLSLPRFKYDYDLVQFKEVLINMGIKDVFDEKNADLTNIMTRENMLKYYFNNLYVGQAIHKTYIELNEVGTKAAAVTYFGIFKDTAMIEPDNKRIINIDFNKTFLYLIRDKNTKEILFIGVVDSPNEWHGTTCSNKE